MHYRSMLFIELPAVQRDPQWEQQNRHAHGNDEDTQTDHLGIIQFHGHKSADRPAYGHAQEKEAGKGSGLFFGQSGVKCQIGAGP